jgi:hypothetical protein
MMTNLFSFLLTELNNNFEQISAEQRRLILEHHSQVGLMHVNDWYDTMYLMRKC